MIIKYVKVKNYRQFLGENYIEFSVDPEKKATLILAPNATGKSTMIDAFQWILYDSSNLKTIINLDLSRQMAVGEQNEVSGEIGLVHNKTEYKISRRASFVKTSVSSSAKLGPSKSMVQYIDGETGAGKTLVGDDVKSFVNEILPHDLFSYFFFDGENIEKIGREISTKKNSQNSEFNRAIRGMLGLNWLYAEKDDLKKVVRRYEKEIEANRQDETYAQTQGQYNSIIKKLDSTQVLKDAAISNLGDLEGQYADISRELAESDINEVEKYQKLSIDAVRKINEKTNAINTNRQKIFKEFSKQGYLYFSKGLINKAIDFLDENADLSQGIPGMDMSAIEWILKNHKCLCGKEFCDGDETYTAIENLTDKVLPNNFSGDISSFKTIGNLKSSAGTQYKELFDMTCKALNDDQDARSKLLADKKKYDDKVSKYPDMKAKKESENGLREQIQTSNRQIGAYDNTLDQLGRERDKVQKILEKYKVTDMNLKKLQEYKIQAEWLLKRVSNTCLKYETEKKNELEEAINSIFKEVYNLDIRIRLNDSYDMSFESNDEQALEDFEGSTSADAIVAFSFIGGIIRLARTKTTSSVETNNDVMDLSADDFAVEPYPLFMDAPSSSFDIDHIRSFCKVMPNIAEQVVFFIKDTDGLHVKENLNEIIGKEYLFEKETTYHTLIKEVK